MPYHVKITLKGRPRRDEDVIALDKDAGWIEEHISAPRREGRDIDVDDRSFSWAEIDRIRINETDKGSWELIRRMLASNSFQHRLAHTPAEWYVTAEGRDVTDQFIISPPGTGPRTNTINAAAFAANRKAVMVIYGHDTEANAALFDWLSAIRLEPQEWNQLIHATGNASPYIGQVLDKALQDVQAVIAYFTPDEYATAAASSEDSRRDWRLQARPNVLIEAGMALITHPARTVLVVLGTQELPSDLAGRHYIRLSHTDPAPLHDLAGRLRDAGCDTDTTGTRWLDPARFPDRTITPPSGM